jgi:hypothetical protein
VATSFEENIETDEIAKWRGATVSQCRDIWREQNVGAWHAYVCHTYKHTSANPLLCIIDVEGFGPGLWLKVDASRRRNDPRKPTFGW